jgi:hypothetical protein
MALQYKLRMFSVPLIRPANIFCNNQSVVHNATTPESSLNKKHNAICYHQVREAAAAQIIRVAKEDSDTNLADALMKSIPTHKRKQAFSGLLYGLYGPPERNKDQS